MKCNVGTKEKIARLIIAIVAGVLGYMLMAPCLYVIAAIALITAAVGYCPLSHVLGANTCDKKEENLVDGDNEVEPAEESEENFDQDDSEAEDAEQESEVESEPDEELESEDEEENKE